MTRNTARKILFFDIDGTLITNDSRRLFPDSAKRAIRMARERGHLAFINSGRVFVNIDDFIREAGFDGYVCGCGTYIIAQGRELLHHQIPQERCRAIARKARECQMLAIYEHTFHTGYDGALFETGNTEAACPEEDMSGWKEILDYFRSMKRKLIDDIESPEFCFDKFAAWYSAGNQRVAEFKEYVGRDFNCIQREGNFLEVVPKGFSKATGIQRLLEYYHISVSDAYVFGDSNNDLEMLQYVPNSIAMGGCTPEVEAVAAYRTAGVMEDGLYHAMKYFEVI